MNLLPKTTSDFSHSEYWDSFFAKRKKEFEWYGNYKTLSTYLLRYIKPSNAILVIGAGNSTLSHDLHMDGYSNVTSIDVSDVVIQQMKEKYPHLRYLKMDMLQMDFEDETYDVVIDKGTLDALFSEESEINLEKTNKLFLEVSRVLHQLGRYIIISLLQPFILKSLVSFFNDRGWHMKFSEVMSSGIDLFDSTMRTFPVFVITCTKMKPGGPSLPLVLEMAGKSERLTSVSELQDKIHVHQNTFLVKSHIRNHVLKEEVSLELFSPNKDEPRFYLYILDQEKRKSANKSFAVFIVPQGWETEWTFGTPKGRQILLADCQANRLVVVHFSRYHSYDSLDQVQEELKSSMADLFFQGKDEGITFLSLGTSCGERKIRTTGTSHHSGKYIVEDVFKETDNWCRNLIFENRPNVVQSEAKLKAVKISKGKNKSKKIWKVDISSLTNDYHQCMVAGLACLGDIQKNTFKLLVLGLGGGSLPSFINFHFPNLQLEVVEIDKAMVEVATTWFGLPREVKVHVDDALNFLEAAYQRGDHFDAIMVDVDNKDPNIGMSCPPAAFVECSLLRKMHNLVSPGGVVILNLVARDKALEKKVLEDLKSIFSHVLVSSILEDLNKVVLASPCPVDMVHYEEHLKALSEHLKKSSSSSFTLDIEEITKALKML